MINGKKIEAINIKLIHCENDGISNDNITFTLTLDIATKSEKHRSAGCVNEIVYVTVVINSLINVNYFVDFAGFLYSSDSSSKARRKKKKENIKRNADASVPTSEQHHLAIR